MTGSSLELLKTICTLEQESLHDFLYDFLCDYYTEDEMVEHDGSFIYAAGTVDVCVVAHLDTVHRAAPKADQIYFDSEKQVMWSPVGIGADDRCGVFIIMNLLFNGYKPHILFTWHEEIGGFGAQEAAKFLSPNLNFIIQFDRRGSAQSVYYFLKNKEFEDYINSFGFKTEIGSYTDICELAPAWECAAVNLSAGYDGEHSFAELILLPIMKDTLTKSMKILDDQISNPRQYKYLEDRPTYKKPDYSKYYYEDSMLEKDSMSISRCLCYDSSSVPWYGYEVDENGICEYCNERVD